jgi:DNA repair photolyase
MVAPVIPRINDHEIETILGAVAERGAGGASYVLLRLPHEVAPLFRDWLAQHYPERAKAVMSAIASCRGGRDYDARFHARMRGEGLLADMIARRFEVARRRHGLHRALPALDTGAFRPPAGPQLGLFDQAGTPGTAGVTKGTCIP